MTLAPSGQPAGSEVMPWWVSRNPSYTTSSAAARSPTSTYARRRAAKRLADAEEDILAYMALLPGHWTRLLPSNPLGRLNRDVKRCPEIVGVLHDQDSAIRPARLRRQRRTRVGPDNC